MNQKQKVERKFKDDELKQLAQYMDVLIKMDHQQQTSVTSSHAPFDPGIHQHIRLFYLQPLTRAEVFSAFGHFHELILTS